MEEAVEREAIARTVKVLSEIAGSRPVGWHTRSAPSPNTRRLLVEEGGFLYDSDDYSDDLPFFVKVSGKRHLVLPLQLRHQRHALSSGVSSFRDSA